MPKKKSPGTALVPVPPVVNAIRPMAGDLVQVDAIYKVPAIRPHGDGPWQAEAEKIAWTDPMTGYGCIIRRSPDGGYLCGYVAVPPGHPLYERWHRTLVGWNLRVHNGLDYSAHCARNEPESRSICHVVVRLDTSRQRIFENAAAAHDDAWWFGFSCNGESDLVPGISHRARKINPDGIDELTYRNEAFVYRECTRLAAQLKAVERGLDPAECFGAGLAPRLPGRTEG